MGLDNEKKLIIFVVVSPNGPGSEIAQAGSGPSGAGSRQGVLALHRFNEYLAGTVAHCINNPAANPSQLMTRARNALNEVDRHMYDIKQTATRLDMSVRHLIHELNERTQQHDNQQREQIETLRSAVTALRGHVEGMGGRREGLRRRLEGLNGHLEGLDAEGRLAEFGERIGDLNNRTDRLRGKVELLDHELYFLTHPGDTFRRVVKYFFNRRPFSFFYSFDE